MPCAARAGCRWRSIAAAAPRSILPPTGCRPSRACGRRSRMPTSSPAAATRCSARSRAESSPAGLLGKIRKSPLKWALRVDKMTCAALKAPLRLYLHPGRLLPPAEPAAPDAAGRRHRRAPRRAGRGRGRCVLQPDRLGRAAGRDPAERLPRPGAAHGQRQSPRSGRVAQALRGGSPRPSRAGGRPDRGGHPAAGPAHPRGRSGPARRPRRATILSVLHPSPVHRVLARTCHAGVR